MPRPAEVPQPPEKKRWWSRKPAPEDILTPKERKVLKKVKSRAHFLDQGISCCCIKVGFDGVVGLIPVLGDFIGLILAFHVVELAMGVGGLPRSVLSQMIFNIAVDFVIGLVPLIGDILDIFYKCNTRNAILLEQFLLKRRQEELLKEASV
ncbi:hypothetical protein EC973_001037 [Apophysomyces ossiformis]|uniref:DUF4112 domain-containing protein n=1 Tax=Apophysomyces ossiformis TaxID=679940 RepID=A0A8H7BWU6_9FUNG|nr:hypothetical protein EC973_001037 [Apophysomyces ossiformis]